MASPAAAACVFKKVAELPVTMSGLRPLVPVKINGVQSRFLADSGAFMSTITWKAATDAGVRGRGTLKGVQGVSGEAAVDVGVANSFELAGIPFGSVTLLIGADVIGGDAAGLLGQNFLGQLDVEYDLANGVIRLFKADGCDDAFLAYWATDKRAGMLPMAARSRRKPDIIVTAAVNGEPIRALLDTGASVSMLRLSAASRAGIKTSSEGVHSTDALLGISGRSVQTWLAPVASFAFGDEEVRNTRLRISDVNLEDADMIIGADFFLSHRVFVSNSQRRLYFTYNGGPVFRLDGGPPTLSAAGETPTDASGYARRGAAFAARRDYDSALADYAKAIALEPQASAHHAGRALVYLTLQKRDLAMKDLDEAIRLAPDDDGLHMQRARLRLAGKDPAGAQADVDATLGRLGPDELRLRELAVMFRDAGYFREAVGYYDRWIATHADHKLLDEFMNARCWARGLWGQELDQALRDCDAALRRRPHDAEYLDSRGLVRLRLGQLDAAIADYDDALRSSPQAAWTRYARGLARRRKGLVAEGDADMAAALKLAPDVAAFAKRYGLADDAKVTQASP